MKRRIFRTILGITLFILLSAFGIVLSYLYSYFAGIEEIRLQDQLELACIGTEQKGYDYLSALPQAGYRLTWTDPDGRVIWDSRAKADTMDNHREREEIREALLFGKGSSVRYSSTLTEKTVYQAKRLIDGSILRISVSSSNIMRLLLTIVPPLIFVLFISSVLCALLLHT